MDVDYAVEPFLQQQAAAAPAQLKPYYAQFAELHRKKLWHQLTVAVQRFQAEAGVAPYLLPLYEHFIKDFEKKMNPISLIEFLTQTSHTLNDPVKAHDLLSARADKLRDDAHHKDAYVMASAEAASHDLAAGNLERCKAVIEACRIVLDSLPSVEPRINASFYRVAANYYKAKQAYPQHYHNALLFLSSINLSDLSKSEQHTRAYELTLSALLGEGLYNFGELLQHAVLQALVGTPHEWLYRLLFCFNSGDMDRFNQIAATKEYAGEPALVNQEAFLRQKLCLMTLIESVFKRSKLERGRISFDTIAQEARVPLDDVEHLVMKALSLGLIRGLINQVDQYLSVAWVTPRVLDKSQITSMRDRFAAWETNVHSWVGNLERFEGAKEIFSR
ncbi:hypothetical protein CXG81DRAFT_15156 [Caulochytrium protostelioides]|uniref:PCI domain-containing protein n=1 Tax=Caulochytrium protostelioides TaxID=1555241 RepID=A0A4P9X2P0_9FUNG|nr:hypothetical protein CXG81DRAFT_15156 [Caulochytrium protostelioides]|eukprot:RKO99010.1 hypothetical protein CXG81DRAFT_15156 [Caulochytrium protostelioides]